MLRKMGEAVARVARKVNETVESGSDTLGEWGHGFPIAGAPKVVCEIILEIK